MSQILLTLTDSAKIEAFLAFVKDLNYVEKAEVLPETKVEPLPTDKQEGIPAPVGYDYAVEEIQAIADRFPKNYAWTAPDLEKYFPQDLKISVQIIQNQLFIMPCPTNLHQALSEELTFQLGTFIRQNKLGKLRYAPFDIKFDNDNVFQPDIIFVSIARLDVIQEKGIVGAPDLVVEIWSPANKKKERDLKHELYEKNGVTEYWQIFPKKKKISIEVLNEAGKYEVFAEAKKTGKVQSKVLEGFSVDVAELWASCEA
jgi:Uma2 family endonuclease